VRRTHPPLTELTFRQNRTTCGRGDGDGIGRGTAESGEVDGALGSLEGVFGKLVATADALDGGGSM